MTDLQILLIEFAATFGRAGYFALVNRVAAAPGMFEGARAAVARVTEQPALGRLGQPRADVLVHKFDLDERFQ